MWLPNPKRIREIFSEENVRLAAQEILAWRNREVLRVLAWGWGIVLLLTATLLLTIRIGLTLPLPWHG